jgi:nitrite reductase/ring-hydroxylating ferredoxin subunit
VGSADLIPSDRPVPREVAGVRLALVRIEGEVYAVEDRCPHMGHPLSQGELHEGRLICPRHRWEFDLRAGPPPSAPELGCRLLPVRERGGQLLVRLEVEPET